MARGQRAAEKGGGRVKHASAEPPPTDPVARREQLMEQVARAEKEVRRAVRRGAAAAPA